MRRMCVQRIGTTIAVFCIQVSKIAYVTSENASGRSQGNDEERHNYIS